MKLEMRKFDFREVYRLSNVPNNIRYYFDSGNDNNVLYEITSGNNIMGYIVGVLRKGKMNYIPFFMKKEIYMLIDCELLFDAIQKSDSKPHWLAGMILILDVSQDTKYKLGKLLLKDEEVMKWFLTELYEGDNNYAGQ